MEFEETNQKGQNSKSGLKATPEGRINTTTGAVIRDTPLWNRHIMYKQWGLLSDWILKMPNKEKVDKKW